MTRTLKAFAASSVLAFGATLAAQTAVPEIPFDSVADLLKTLEPTSKSSKPKKVA